MASSSDQLKDFISYALGYVRLTRQGILSLEKRNSVSLSAEELNLPALLDGNLDENPREKINLSTFEQFEPAKVPEESRKDFDQQQQLAVKIEDLHNKQLNQRFTKEAVLHFGYFKVELPLDQNATSVEELDDEPVAEKKTKEQRFPLFTLPVSVEKEAQDRDKPKFSLIENDADVQVNISALQPLLGDDAYYRLLEKVNQLQVEGELSIPIPRDSDCLKKVWRMVKEELALTKAKYDDNSFKQDEIVLSLRPKSNYFLAEDLEQLAEIDEEELSETALASWTEDSGLNEPGEMVEPRELLFPFSADKYQSRVITLLNLKAGIVEGPPGTGKSETITNVLSHLAATGKRVLFVSQKPQALKVVKDKLKRLEVQYLYGYIPNPNSAEITEQDEIDGIAVQLAGLKDYMQKLSNFSETDSLSPKEAEDRRQKFIEQFNRSLKTERELSELLRKSDKITEELPVKELDRIVLIARNLTPELWKEMTKASKALKATAKKISTYKSPPKLAGINRSILNEVSLLSYVEEIANDVNQSGYDKKSGLGRSINNSKRNLRLRKQRSALPREVRDYIDEILDKDLSRREAHNELQGVMNAFAFYKYSAEKVDLTAALSANLNKVGLTNSEFEQLEKDLNASKLKKLNTQASEVVELQKEIGRLKKEETDLDATNEQIKKSGDEKFRRVQNYIRNRVNQKLLSEWNEISIRQNVAKLAKAFSKSKKAFRTFEKLKDQPETIQTVLDCVPIWIMELDDASRLLPLEKDLFDYVILDEASQCNVAYTLPSMFRAKHVLFVGDSEQMRDTTIGFKSNRSFDELAKKNNIPEELRIKSTGEAVQSVLDIAALRGLHSISLRYHYRSPRELIGFSNEYFYKPKGKELISLNSKYLPWKNTSRVLVLHPVEVNEKIEIADKVNVSEAQEILKFYQELRKDPQYKDLSVGILTFFNAQATYIRELFEREGFQEDRDNFKVSIVEGIQGDEKDIILLSLVIKSGDPLEKRRYLPLTGEGGDIRGDINRGRVNVAFSRARKQLHCFCSVPEAELPEGIWIKKFVKYVTSNGEIKSDTKDLQPFDSEFEEEFYNLANGSLDKNFRIQNQVGSCGFKIDFVITNLKNGKRLAIECDGPTHYKDELDAELDIYVDNDEERQQVLESAGWEFFRINYSRWQSNESEKKETINKLREALT